MLEESYNKYTKLKKEKEGILKQLDNLNENTSSNNVPIINVGRLNLTYGNGNWTKCICTNNQIMIKIRDLLNTELNIKLEDINKQMKEL